MVLSMKLLQVAVAANVASAFAPSASWTRSAVPSSLLHATVPPIGSGISDNENVTASIDSEISDILAASVEKEISDQYGELLELEKCQDICNPYETPTLEDILCEAASKFHVIAKHGIPAGYYDIESYFNGYPEKAIPPLEPLDIGTISMPIKNDLVDTTLTLNDAVLKGFDSIRLTWTPSVNFKDFSVGISFHIKELELSTDDYDREESFKLLFRYPWYDLSKFDRELIVKLCDIDVNLKLDLEFEDLYNPTLTVVPEASKIEIGKLKTDLEDSVCFDIISPLLKWHVASAIAKNMKEILETHLTAQLQDACASEIQWVENVDKLYKLRAKTDHVVDANGNQMKPQIVQGFWGVGQLPFPMFWDVPTPPEDTMEHISMEEIIEHGKTGDLILVSCNSPDSLSIRRWTQSPYSHAVMIVKEPELLNGKTVLIQSSRSEQLDLLTNKRIRGLQVNDIEDYMVDFKKQFITGNKNPSCLAFRRLRRQIKHPDEEHQMSESLVKFIKETSGVEYAADGDMESLYLLGLSGAKLEDQNVKQTFYCASYVAQALMKKGIIGTDFPSQQYSPRDFSQMVDVLPFLDPHTSYGPEKLIDIP